MAIFGSTMNSPSLRCCSFVTSHMAALLSSQKIIRFPTTAKTPNTTCAGLHTARHSPGNTTAIIPTLLPSSLKGSNFAFTGVRHLNFHSHFKRPAFSCDRRIGRTLSFRLRPTPQSDGASANNNPLWKQRFKMIIVSIISSGSAIVLYDYFAKRKLEDELFFWDDNWDAAWRLTPDATDATSQLKLESWPKLSPQLRVGNGNDSIPKKATRQIILIRHGQYRNVESSDDDIQGLTDNGRRQAHLTGQRLASLLKGKNAKAIHFSNLKRAQETAEIISSYLPKVATFGDGLLAEGVPIHPEPASVTFQPTDEEVQRDNPRIEAAFQKIFYRASPPSNDEGRSDNDMAEYEIVVCHGNVIRYFFCRGLQFPTNAWLRLATFNCGITWMSVDHEGRVCAREFGNVGHLPTDMITYH